MKTVGYGIYIYSNRLKQVYYILTRPIKNKTHTWAQSVTNYMREGYILFINFEKKLNKILYNISHSTLIALVSQHSQK